MTITGHTEYKGYTAQQCRNFTEVFTPFLLEHKFTHVLEIGTAGGGFTSFLRDALPEAKILSFDVYYQPWYEKIRANNIDIQIRNIFNDDIRIWTNVAKVVDPQAIDFLKESGKKLILCDGGNKIGEFNCLSNYMNVGDFIMAHDYAYSHDYFKENVRDKFWNWCEIEEKYIEEHSKLNNLEHYNKDAFQSIVWVCKAKVK